MKKYLIICFIGYWVTFFSLGCRKEDDQSALKRLDLASLSSRPAVQQNRYPANDQISDSRRTAITTAVELVSNAVCGINVTQMREYVRSPFPFYDDPFFRFFFPEVSQASKELRFWFLNFKRRLYCNQ
ncbi:MAG: hypothetical protein ACE5NG_21360 [bacterium]